ncbi:hypothetical protein tb265_48390 [Gemmatimonadetes bacterium T265]|nr:hypothetical protein tb265_48390 [Gemmatimonadetes bacterium T265]
MWTTTPSLPFDLPDDADAAAPLPMRDAAQLDLGLERAGSGESEHFPAAMDDYSGVGSRRAARRSTVARRGLTLLALTGLAAGLLPARAHALFGLPSIVFDPTAVAKLIAQINQLQNQLTVARANAAAFVANTRKLTSSYAWRNINTAVATVDGLMASGQALGYSAGALPGRLAATFPGYAYNPATVAADVRARHEAALATFKGALVAGQATGLQIGQSMAQLGTMKRQLAAATSAQQAAEISATALVTQAEEAALLRQQLLAQASAEAVRAADEANRELQGTAAVQALITGPARALTTNPPVRPRMDPAAYAF